MSDNKDIPNLIDQNLLLQEESWLWSASAERGVLACIMAEPKSIWEAERLIKPQWFFYPLHQYIFRVLLYVARKALKNNWQVSFDEMTVMSVVQECGPEFVNAFLRKMDGMVKWREISEAVRFTSTESFGGYMATMKDRAARVKMFREARKLQQAVMDLNGNPVAATVAGRYESQLGQIAFGSSDDDESKMRLLGHYADPLLHKSRLNYAFPEKHLFHLRHPRFPYWMNLMGGGFRRNSLTIIAARAKVGKTTLLLNMAIDFALMGVPVLFLDTEMSGEEMISRELSNIAEIDEHALIAGKFMSDGAKDERRVIDAVSRIKGAPFHYACIAGKDADFAVSSIRQFRNNHVGSENLEFEGKTLPITKPCAVFYDWLKLPVGAATESAKEYQLLGDLCSKIKDTAKLLNLPVIAGAQQNRAGVGKDEHDHAENAESYISGSDRLAMFCNTLCTLRNPSMKLAEEIAANWPDARPAVHEGHESQRWPFNQILQVVLQRQGKENRYGIPMYIDRGHAKYDEVIGDDRNGYLRWVEEGRKGSPNAEWFRYVNFLRDSSKVRKAAKKAKEGVPDVPTPVAHPVQPQPGAAHAA